MITSSIIALAGIGLAAALWWPQASQWVDRLTRAADTAGVYRLSRGKFFFDEIYQVLVVWPLVGIARLSYWFDRLVIDGTVNLIGRIPPRVGADRASLVFCHVEAIAA